MARSRSGYGYGYGSSYGFFPRVSVDQRRREAAKRAAALAKKGRKTSPVRIEGRKITRTFWGHAWCENLESYSDFANRLPRGRSYVRNGAVLDLKIEKGKVVALVSGSSLYDVEIKIVAVAGAAWKRISGECAGRIDSLVELLEGRLSGGVMEVMTRKDGGLFPTPKEIRMKCSCPDYATLCKHVAATLYGVGARLDEKPELLFTLRQVDHLDLVGGAASEHALRKAPDAGSSKALDGADLSAIFGIEIEAGTSRETRGPKTPRAPRTTKTTKTTKSTKSRARAARATTVTAKDLVGRGVPHATIQSWLRAGVLVPTGRRGVYRSTPETESRIAAHLEKRGRRPPRG